MSGQAYYAKLPPIFAIQIRIDNQREVMNFLPRGSTMNVKFSQGPGETEFEITYPVSDTGSTTSITGKLGEMLCHSAGNIWCMSRYEFEDSWELPFGKEEIKTYIRDEIAAQLREAEEARLEAIREENKKVYIHHAYNPNKKLTNAEATRFGFERLGPGGTLNV